MAISRRQFVGLGAGAVCTFAFGGAVKAFGANGELLRPPVVLDEDDFIAKCVRCNRCIGVCHTGALASATLEDGLLEIKTPKFDFHRGPVIFAMSACACAQRRLLPLATRWHLPQAELDAPLWCLTDAWHFITGAISACKPALMVHFQPMSLGIPL